MSVWQSQFAPVALSGNWWTLLLRGIAAAAFGLAALFWPGLTLFVLLIFFGAYAVVDGAFSVVAGLRSSAGHRTWLLVAEGSLGIVAGLVALVWPGLTAFALLYLIAAWAIITGLLKIVTAVSLRREIPNEWLMALSGALSVVVGAVLAVLPGVGLLSLVWLIGIYALVFGVALAALSFRVRGHRGDIASRVR